MNIDKARAASNLLRKTWDAGAVVDDLPADLRPATRAEGYAIQAVLDESMGPLYGWKIAATSVAGQKHINVDGPLAGRIFRSRIVADGGTVPLGANRMAVAEAEFAFRMGRDLPPRATRSISARTMRSTMTGRLSSSHCFSIGRNISRT